MLATTVLRTTSFELAVYQKGDVDAKKLALVLPGRLDTKDYPHMRSHVDFLAQSYLALSFDPPGTWESKGDISLYSTTSYLQAIKEIVEHYGKPTLLVGHSRGGSVAILAGTRIKAVEAFVSVMGKAFHERVVDEEWKKRGVMQDTRETPEEYEERTKVFDLPYAFVEDSFQYDSLEDLPFCKKPKLFIGGDKDSIVPLHKIEQAYAVSSEPKKLAILHSDHDYRKDEGTIQEVNRLIEEFITEVTLG